MNLRETFASEGRYSVYLEVGSPAENCYREAMRHCLVSLGAFLLAAAHLHGAACHPVSGDPNGNYLWPGVVAGIPYTSGAKLDAFAPSGVPRPPALLIHGSSGDKATHLTQLFPLLAEAGYAWFSVDYRDLNDLRAALNFIACPGRYPIQQQFTVIAEDAGVTLALQLSSDVRITQVIGFGATAAAIQKVSSSKSILLFHGSSDEEVSSDSVENTCRRWKNCRFIAVPRGIHNLENWHPDQWEWREEFVAALRQQRAGLWQNITYSRPGGLPLLMDAYLPEGPGPHPAVIIAHGGGWEAGDKFTYIGPVLGPLAKAGYAWFSMDYRLTPYVRNAEQLEDLRNAIRYIRRHAARYHIDPQRIAILGESASGQMVAQVASEPCPGCEVQAVISFYGVYDFTQWSSDPGSKDMLDRIFGVWDDTALRRYSPLFHVHPEMPPILLLQGTADELYPGTLAYEKALTSQRVPHELILLDKAPHGMENWAGHPEWAFYTDRLLAWLKKSLIAAAPDPAAHSPLISPNPLPSRPPPP